jgi:hypothetical protein
MAKREKLLRVYKLSGDYFVAVFYSIDRSLVVGKMRELPTRCRLPEIIKQIHHTIHYSFDTDNHSRHVPVMKMVEWR